MRTLLSLEPDEREQVRGPMRRLTDQMVMEDTAMLLTAFETDMHIIGALHPGARFFG